MNRKIVFRFYAIIVFFVFILFTSACTDANKSFEKISAGLEKSSIATDKIGNSHLIKLKLDSNFYASAIEVDLITKDIVSFTESIIDEIIVNGNGVIEPDLVIKFEKPMDRKVVERIIFDQGKGAELRKKILAANNKLNTLLDSTNINMEDVSIDDILTLTNENVETDETWEVHYFSYTNLTLATTLLRQVKNEVINYRNSIYKKMLEKAENESLIIN